MTYREAATIVNRIRNGGKHARVCRETHYDTPTGPGRYDYGVQLYPFYMWAEPGKTWLTAFYDTATDYMCVFTSDYR